MEALLERTQNLLAAKPVNEDQLTNALGKLSKFCLQENLVATIAHTPGLVPGLLHIAETYCPKDVSNRALICLGNLALFPASSQLDENEALLDLAINLANRMLLNPDYTEEELDCGLSCAFILCRLVGRKESGRGVDVLESNPIVLDKLYWILEQVLDVGEEGTVLGFSWDPCNIVSDISMLSNSDRMKPLVVRFIPLILRALKEDRAKLNFRMLKLASHALAQFVFERQSFPLFWPLREEIAEVLLSLLNNAKFRQEEPEYMYVRNEVEGLIGSLRAMNPPKGESPLATALARALAVIPRPPQKHVMISYQWDNVELATELQVAISQHGGFRTWMDVMDIGKNFHASVTHAVEHALAMVCVVSQGYFDSLSCRQECEYADVREVPIIWVAGTKFPFNWSNSKAWLNAIRKNDVLLTGDDVVDHILKRLDDLQELQDDEESESEGSDDGDDGDEEEEEGKEEGVEDDGKTNDLAKMMQALRADNLALSNRVKDLEASNQELLTMVRSISLDMNTLLTKFLGQ